MNPGNESLHPAVREARLAEELAALKGAVSTLAAPAEIEDALVRRFRDSRVRSGTATRPRLWWMPPLALAATLGAVSWIVRGPAPVAPDGPPVRIATAAGTGPFLALMPLDRIALEPAATVVETEFPRALLAQWGLPVAPERAGEPVRAEMLYSQAGEALAVRFIE